MREDQRIWLIKEAIHTYVKSPSLRHIRDAHSVHKLAVDIVRSLDRSNSIWQKWDGQRETVLKSAMFCWIPIDDLCAFLNGMPGPNLTKVDVTQRLHDMQNQDHWEYPNEELKDGCLEIYEREKALGTELPAIIGHLQEHVENENDRLLNERQKRIQELREQETLTRERRLLSGADCPWTNIAKSAHWYCRRNGRTYRLSPARDGKRDLFRVVEVSDDAAGELLGCYRTRGDASRAVAKIAYQPE